MLGSNRTITDLLSVVLEYSTKDLDDVKMGILAHLSEFFEVGEGGSEGGRGRVGREGREGGSVRVRQNLYTCKMDKL